MRVVDKILNIILSSARVPNEHVIAGVKRLRVVRDVLRLRGQEQQGQTVLTISDQLMEVACALHNLRQNARRTRIPIPLRDFTLYC